MKLKTEASITFAGWLGAIEEQPFAKVATASDTEIQNPQTGLQISMAAAKGDPEIWLEVRGARVLALRCRHKSRNEMNAMRDFDEPTSFLRNLCRSLAVALKAGINGGEDEEYR